MIARLHHITQDLLAASHAAQALAALEGGAKWIQFRTKLLRGPDLIEQALLIKNACVENGATFIVNDDPVLAKQLQADGVHLGKTDMPIGAARELLGTDFIIGGTANTAEDVAALIAAGVDYVGLGPFRNTSTKKNLSPILGLDGLLAIADLHAAQIPIIAIGGIETEDVREVVATGVHGIAVASGINQAQSPTDAVKLYFKNLDYVDA